MGMCLHKIKSAHRLVKQSNNRKLETGFVWIVGRRDTPDDPAIKADWHIQGVASSEILAVEMCEDHTYFIGPLPINTALPYETIEWIGLYFPLLEKEKCP